MSRGCPTLPCFRRSAFAALIAVGAFVDCALGAKRVVLLEKLSATWCSHCMAAAQSLDDLVKDHADQFIPLEIFSRTANGGRYEIPWGRSRTFDFYSLSGYPTAWFDGVTSRSGAVNAYGNYLSRINSRLAVPTDIAIEVTANRTGNRTYDVTAAVSLETTGSARTVRVQLVEALDQFGVYDDGVTAPRNTLKQVLEPGIDVFLSPRTTQLITRSVTLDNESWSAFDDIRLIAWAQAPQAVGPAEVFNAGQLAFSDLLAGDFDSNGLVTGSDLGLWRAAFGKTSGADANGDGVTDGADLLRWQRTLGNSGPGSVDAAGAVPEPRSLVTFCVIFAFLCASTSSSTGARSLRRVCSSKGILRPLPADASRAWGG
jgi:thiol-disulfide isomerase/thioredoxin